MKKMLKRADGSTSRRGLWDNIRANKGSGKEPTKEMLKQEKKIKAKKYQTAGPKFTVTGLSANAAPGKQCVGAGCKDVIAGGSSYAGVSGSNYTGAGATGLSSKPQYADRVVKKSAEQIAADQAVIDTRQAKMAANQADRQARREANLAAFKEATAPKPEVQYDFKRVYATEPGMQKTGGKKKSSWLEESKELKFGGPSKKYQTAGPTMSTKEAVGQVFQGKMTAAQGQAAIGKTPKPAMTPEQKTEFMSKLKTYGKKTGGKKKMGGKNC
jgi:hypothetical protein